MLTRIDVESENTFFVPIALATPKDSLLIKKITGLDPPPANLFIGEYSRDGGSYQGRRVGVRNVVITLDLNPNPALDETVSGLRDLLYKAFMDPLTGAEYVKLNFHDDEDRIRYLVGYVENFETEIFSDDSVAQISLLCPDPYLRDTVEKVHTNVSGWTTVPFTYQGTSRTGFRVICKITNATSVLTLDNNGQKMIFNRSFAMNDIVTISTTPGDRYATITPAAGGGTNSIIANLTATSPWPLLSSQANTMRIYGSTTSNVVAAITELRYRQAYWGV